jgi:hypothetical protein
MLASYRTLRAMSMSFWLDNTDPDAVISKLPDV